MRGTDTMTFAELLAIVRMHGGDARLFTFDGGASVYVTGLGLTAEESHTTSCWGDPKTATQRMAERLRSKGLDVPTLAN